MRTSSWFHGSHTLHRFGIGAWHKSLQLVKKKTDEEKAFHWHEGK